MIQTYDIAIVGGGMVGAALAAMLADLPLRVAVLEPRPPGKPKKPYELRVSALSPASRNILESAGAWNSIDESRIAVYRDMQVWDAEARPGGFGSIHFDSAELGVPDLGYIIENNRIQYALFDRIRDRDAITLIESGLEELDSMPGAMMLTLTNGEEIQARLVVGADGGASKTRDLAGISSSGWDYEQRAVVANVETERGHGETAWQRFLRTGPIAMLPLADGRCSIVWSTTPEHAAELCELNKGTFCAAVADASDRVRGDVRKCSKTASFPLRLRYAEQYCADRVALIGDAAHAVHPLAGQGVNLGFLDAAAMCDVIEQGIADNLSPGDRRLLRRYERWRKGDNALTMMSLDALKRLFGTNDAVVSVLRRGGLSMVDRLAFIKHLFARYATGTGMDMPRRARPAGYSDEVLAS